MPTLALSAAALLAVLVILWSARSAEEAFHTYQDDLMANEGRSVAAAIGEFVRERTRLLALFAERNRDLLDQLMNAEEDPILQAEVGRILRSHFPTFFAFTLRRPGGMLVPDDLGEFVGPVCRADIEHFAGNRERVDYRPFIHPQPGNYHFDMMTFWRTPDHRDAILFVSFHPDRLTTTLARFQLPGHRVVLVRDDMPDLIEATAEGARDTLDRPIRLTAAEERRVAVTLPVEHSRWVVKVFAEEGFFERETRRIHVRAAYQLLVVFLFWAGAAWYLRWRRNQHEEAHLRLSEQTDRLLKSQEIAHVGCWDWNIASGRIEWTAEIHKIFGRSPDDFEATYENFLTCVHPEDRQALIAAVDASLEKDERYDIEHRILLPSGAIRIVHELGSVYRDGAGKPTRMLGVVHDVTERTELSRTKNEFISTVSHELRTPLTSIKGSLGLLAGGAAGQLSEKGMTMVDIARTNAERLIEIVNDILDIEKLESGMMDFQFGELGLGDLLADSVRANQGFADRHGIRLAIEPDVPAVEVWADDTRALQVLANLISNAVKFSPPDGRVTLSARVDGPQVRITVSDQGPGIPEEFRERIFEKFVQVDGSDRRAKSGTGLGLSICMTIVQAHGGEIDFTAREGGGTNFVFGLPLSCPKTLPK